MNSIEKELENWKELRRRYPASSWVSLWYAKILQEHYPETYEQEKSHLLLSFFDRKRFHQFVLPNLQEEEKTLANENSSGEENSIATENQQIDNQAIIKENSIVTEKVKKDETSVAREEVEEGIIDNLIEKFSNDPPKIQFNPEVHDENVNYGKSSCVENPEIISETLAVLYAQQGYVGKAVKIYKKLALHNPEKSCYFADQIKKLKSENK